MYSHTLRVARSSGKGLGLALGRIGGGAARVRSVSATSATGTPVPGDQGVAMEHPKQQLQPQVPTQDAAANSKRNDAHKTIGDVMSHSFGEGYATRSEEEGFGGVYGRPDPEEEHSGADLHPEYDTLQGSEVKEKEKARHHRDEKHAT
ncbi:hypothetical protein HU200_048186 [Digitaria exilis]|uniref:Uncharacterized protein n=1 Tax=Digitaria exilis TaxID=1010633 RepID=A0A835E9K2_9POAL|nr:hypothetical protein HU200_048186 [Digitaria exilis]CAB3498391.1 unnamed protein product [Digitaria exilis]